MSGINKKKMLKREKMKKGWKLATELRFAGDPKKEVGPGSGDTLHFPGLIISGGALHVFMGFFHFCSVYPGTTVSHTEDE